MSYLDVGFDENLIRQELLPSPTQQLDPLQFEQYTPEFSGSKIFGTIQSKDGKLLIDLDKGFISVKDTFGPDKVRLGNLESNGTGIKIKGKNDTFLESNENNDVLNLPGTIASSGNLTTKTFRRITNPFKKYSFIPGTQFNFNIPNDLTVLFLVEFLYGRDDFPGQNTYDIDVALDIDGKIYLGNIGFPTGPSGGSNLFFINATVGTTINFFPSITQHTILSLSKGPHQARLVVTNNGDTGLDLDILFTSLSYIAF